jgi:6-pyruvoyltetrahydropterin/6-carboxytetrahydropterin synthase
MTFSVSQSGTFEAAHYIRNPSTPDHYHRLHGHSFVVTVHCASASVGEQGWVIDFGVLDGVLKDVLGTLDHQTLNEIDGLEPPTFENILSYIDRQFEARGVTLSRLEIARPTLGQRGELVKS